MSRRKPSFSEGRSQPRFLDLSSVESESPLSGSLRRRFRLAEQVPPGTAALAFFSRDEDRTFGVTNAVLAYRTEQQSCESPVTSVPDDEEMSGARLIDEHLCWMTVNHFHHDRGRACGTKNPMDTSFKGATRLVFEASSALGEDAETELMLPRDHCVQLTVAKRCVLCRAAKRLQALG